MGDSSGYLDLHDFRRRVASMYRQRDEALQRGDAPDAVCDNFRQAKDTLFAEHPQSALDADHKATFRGLSYFPYDPAACVEGEIDSDVPPLRLSVSTSGEEIMPMERVGIVHFEFNGHPAALSLYWIDVYGGGLFLPFRDATAPTETYGGGRYLIDTVKGSDTRWRRSAEGRTRLLLDFNYAYNPSCSYNHRWVCPLAPPENRLTLSIRAGERRFDPLDSTE